MKHEELCSGSLQSPLRLESKVVTIPLLCKKSVSRESLLYSRHVLVYRNYLTNDDE